MDKTEIKVMKKILNLNDRIADEVRNELRSRGILMINLMSSPGSGKTSLIEKTAVLGSLRMFVIEGDIQTTLDAERILNAGLGAYQINTGPFGGDCHLEAGWIRSALDEINTSGIDILFVENIGNLVCPAEFDIGAHINAVVLSITEGEDKPLKYPLAFRNSQLCVISKTDLMPHLKINIKKIRKNIEQINPEMTILELSAQDGSGLDKWLSYLQSALENLRKNALKP
ncbi:MAG: hydrogenase nickel incorporation protein HypB [Candidatus Cloacimonetes bacterium]|nr:hydrogenase nickel incorporation protein HypB [Candidatus Cloacimonadota bacterium]